MSRLTITKAKAAVFVGLDFGTTFSGFAYALASEPDKVHKFYEWPGLAAAGARNYCKTLSSLLYVKSSRGYVLEDWGYEALVKHANRLQSKQHAKQIGAPVDMRDAPIHLPRSISGNIADDTHTGSHSFVTRFKLLLAEKDPEFSAHNTNITLPEGVTARIAISDYLRMLSKQVMSVLENHLGTHITMEDVQWCLTVPAIWDEDAKREMKLCAQIAGMIQGTDCSDQAASPYPVIIVLEPEAASCYCQQKIESPLTNGDKFLVVDVGGGTVDLVVHEKVGPAGDLKVKEVSPSSGGLCGGTYVDKGFLEFLSWKIKCFRQFSVEHPQSLLKLLGWWETVKHGFDGHTHFAYELELPAKLARAWEADEKSRNVQTVSDASFDVIDMSLDVMLKIFNPVVDAILDLIEERIIEGLKIIMIVGGFSASPYLVSRIRETFAPRVEAIIVPNEPGSAICCGAVLYGINGADVIVSRISKRTYGISVSRPFLLGDPFRLSRPGSTGQVCDGVFDVYVRNGDAVSVNQAVTRKVSPQYSDQTESRICLYSSSDTDPEYVDDAGVCEEGSFVVSHPSQVELGTKPKIKISLYFGRTTVEVKAVGVNFGEGETFVMSPVTFEKSLE